MRAPPPSGIDLLVRPTRVEASLWRRFRYEAEGECRELLFHRYAGLAKSIAAKHFFRRCVKRIDRADYEQFAFEGLLQAIDRFDPLKGVPFGAYARRRIRGSIADGIAQMSEVDAQLSHRHRVEQERLRSLAPAAGSDAPDSAISTLSELAFGLALGMMLEGTSLIEPSDGCDPAPSAYESLEWRELQARLRREIGNLPEKEALIIRQHYDIGLSFAQIADLLELSRGRVSQLHRAAVDRLRKRIGALA
jgi:RNA polymerase sigma factor for flagellar operon FliA